MQGNSGIWIDHKEAFIVFVGEAVAHRTDSHMERRVRYSGQTSHGNGGGEDQPDRHDAAHLSKYYDAVIGHVKNAGSILLFGPGEAKGELEKQMAAQGMAKQIVGVETVDKMTDHQIVAKVRLHY